jgi:hypothetical protein
VQPAFVAAIEPLAHGDAQLRLASGRLVRLARRQRAEVLAALGR